MSETLELVALALYDHGPLTLTDIAAITLIPMNTLRTHMNIHRGHRYQARLTVEDGIPVRRWELVPTSHPPEQETDE